MEQAQDRLAATLAAFEGKIAGIAPAIASAAEQSTREAGAAMLASLDSAAQVTEQASRTNSEQISARIESVAAALAAAASALAQAGVESRAQMAEGVQAISASGEDSAARLTRMVEAFSSAVSRLSTRLDQTEQALGAHNERLDKAGEIVSGASNNLALAAGAMEGAAAPLTTATLTFRDAMARFGEAAARIEQISASGDGIAGHIAAFGAQMSHSLAAFDSLPDKIKATESGFGDEIGRSASALTEAAQKMSAGFERGQSSLAATLASFEAKILAMPGALAEASEQSSRVMGEKVQSALDSVAAAATQASRGGADLFSARVDDISRSLSVAADRLLQASEASGAHLRDSHDALASGAAPGRQTPVRRGGKLGRTDDQDGRALRRFRARPVAETGRSRVGHGRPEHAAGKGGRRRVRRLAIARGRRGNGRRSRRARGLGQRLAARRDGELFQRRRTDPRNVRGGPQGGREFPPLRDAGQQEPWRAGRQFP